MIRLLKYRKLELSRLGSQAGAWEPEEIAQANKGQLEGWTFIPTRDLKYLNKQREGVLVYGR
jgi:hypothetical protein